MARHARTGYHLDPQVSPDNLARRSRVTTADHRTVAMRSGILPCSTCRSHLNRRSKWRYWPREPCGCRGIQRPIGDERGEFKHPEQPEGLSKLLSCANALRVKQRRRSRDELAPASSSAASPYWNGRSSGGLAQLLSGRIQSSGRSRSGFPGRPWVESSQRRGCDREADASDLANITLAPRSTFTLKRYRPSLRPPRTGDVGRSPIELRPMPV